VKDNRDKSPVVVELSGIRLVRNRVEILRGITWSIAAGRHWALLGANGAGKTSLLRVIAGYAAPTAGSVRVLGEKFGACDLRRLRRAIGWVSHSLEQRVRGEDSALETVLSGFDASFGIYREFGPEERRAAERALSTVGAAQVASRLTGRLSQGERQRVILARALVGRPRLLILDEPCLGLDPAARADFLADLARLAESPRCPTLLLVTHHIEEIGPWVKRVLVLQDGVILAAGRPSEVLTSSVLSSAFGRTFSVEEAADGGFRLRREPSA